MKITRNQFYSETKKQLKVNKPTYYVEPEINTGELCEITFYVFLILTILTTFAKCTA